MVALSVLLSAAAITDTSRKKIPNFLVLSVFLWGLVYSFLLGGLSAVFFFLVFSVCVLFLFFPFYQLHLLGAGDVKLLSAMAGFFPVTSFLFFLFYSFSGAFLLSIFSLIFSKKQMTISDILRHRVPMAGPFFISFLFYMGGFY